MVIREAHSSVVSACVHTLSHHALSRYGNAPLACLDEDPARKAFHAWRGASGRRYVASVYPADHAADDLGLPQFDAFVLLAVQTLGSSRHLLDIVAVEREAERRAALVAARSAGASEWHVHLLAASRSERAAAVVDLQAGQERRAPAARCA